ncbi:hypothetical protein [Clostridium sp. AM46-21]|uniref:hypothetical protein n=1 Tax=Clostridium sp. AM46-21 TaxID=2293033 RepID=UPI0011C21CFF
MKDPLKPRDKITQKMSRDGLVEVNETKETAERISRREQETDFPNSRNRQRRTRRHSLPLPVLFQKTIPEKQSASWSISAQRRPGKRLKTQYDGRRKKPQLM